MRIDSMDATIKAAITPTTTSDPNIRPAPVTDERGAANVNQDQEYLAPKVSEAFIRKAVDKANDTMQQHNRSLEFKIHEKTNEIIVKIIDTDTKEVIREIPSEKILDMFANMLELAGLIVDERR